jgi:hypothetical protein
VGFSGLEGEFRALVIVAMSSPSNKISRSYQLVIMSYSPNHKISQCLSTEERLTLSIPLAARIINKYINILVCT